MTTDKKKALLRTLLLTALTLALALAIVLVAVRAPIAAQALPDSFSQCEAAADAGDNPSVAAYCQQAAEDALLQSERRPRRDHLYWTQRIVAAQALHLAGLAQRTFDADGGLALLEHAGNVARDVQQHGDAVSRDRAARLLASLANEVEP